MQDLKYRKSKIQEKRKQTPWREFLMELGSRYGLTFHKTGKRVDGYPNLGRIKLVSLNEFENIRGFEYPIEGSTFMEQFRSLFTQHPFPHIHHIGENENSSYASCIYGSKNAYLSTEVIFASNVLYSAGVKDNSDMVLNSVNVIGGNANIYMSNTIRGSYQVFYSKGILDSSDIWFSSNLQGCKECLFCNGLQNASYQIKNISYPKDQYKTLKKEILSQRDRYDTWFYGTCVAGKISSPSSSGLGLIKTNGVEHGLFASELSNSRNVFFVGGGNDNINLYDTVLAGVPYGKDMYGVFGANGEDYYCCVEVIESSNIFYSMYIENCSYCLGCIGLRNKSYCIFNKQYTKEEWNKKIDKIFAQMEMSGTLGDFFHGGICPHYFNDTAASLIDSSFTKEVVTAKGYAWRDNTIQTDIHKGVDVVKSAYLGEYEGYYVVDGSLQDSTVSPLDDGGTWSINPEVLKKVIQDEEGNLYRIIPLEYKFLKKYGLPLPRIHWLSRLKKHFEVSLSIK